MKIAILPDNDTIGSVGADFIEKLYRDKPDAVLGLATGSSPLPVYKELIKRCEQGRITFEHGRAFTLDEYVGLPDDHPERYSNFIRDNFVSHVNFPEGALQTPNDKADDVDAAAAEYDKSIAAAGGVDLQILGIGSDGHIAFNEPGESLTCRTHVGFLTEQTRRDNARFFNGEIDKVPTQCVTQGLGTIMEARRLLLVAQGKNKAPAIRELAEGAVSTHWPATIIQMHQDAWILIDEDAASLLENKDYYREQWSKLCEQKCC